MSRLGTGARRLSQLSKYIPMTVNYTPTTVKHINPPGTPQMNPQEHFIWNNENPYKGNVPILNLL